jgi:hypothetical protein
MESIVGVSLKLTCLASLSALLSLSANSDAVTSTYRTLSRPLDLDLFGEGIGDFSVPPSVASRTYAGRAGLDLDVLILLLRSRPCCGL